MSKTYLITIEVTVNDEVALAHAAAEVALRDMTAEEWAQTRDPEFAVQSDLTMLFDPGVSPDGTEIEETTVESSW
jgi:hypothetical protein